MKKNDLSGFTVDQLKQQISEEKDRLVKLKFAHAITPIENPKRITETRKNIARLFTEVSGRK
ncbi:MAG: 50S ribosomal protein L29 [Cytophagaceae bacterium]|jgi:large subunit ribosomal protein L29|nr:50S ribosomal protein L29 [Cytophagaceae bacterium]MBK9511396.1 50S ribosomal protein L29 [Cytophagaceae bacterium]MBL0303652.1 50S ribosomal protein L29 [Cytophagaceae bacterium]MBL0326482.1 50S ribosomal protein L29 [Cytophagaceae bacterium]MCA0363159.1 50S ribosomal protein L29 [Bacteroidota bacterium]